MNQAFADACALLYPRTGGATEWSLGPTRTLLEALGRPHEQFATIHVGGTNGKGSTAVLIAEALRVDGRRTAVYTSPHLVSVRERMVVDGRAISESAFAMWTDRLLPVIEATGASFFEATTAIAFADFAARGAEVAVVEVGLGGRLDSTNVVTPLVSAVTNVSREHTSYLGSTLEQIAVEKAGIAKRGVPFVIGETDPALARLLAQEGTAAGAEPVIVSPDEHYAGVLRLLGAHQRRNAAVAHAVLRALPDGYRVSPDAVARGFRQALLPGRFDRRGRWVFDVAHNMDGTRVLADLVAGATLPRPLHAVMAVLEDKDWRAMTDEVARLADVVWITHAPSAPDGRRWDLETVGDHCGATARLDPDFERVLRCAAQEAATVLVCGSFHTVGDAMARLPGFAPLG